MNYSRSKNAILNIFWGYLAQIGILILSFVGRRIFLNYLSIDYLGINGLYSNILTVLSLVELGLDSAVIYSLYKPIAENDKSLVFSLIRFFRKIYWILAAAIFAVGLLLIPLLKFMIKSDLSQQDLILYYILFLTNTVASYFVAHKVALLSAHQELRIQKSVSLSSNLILQFLHIIVLVIWHNYYLYVIATVCTTIINNVILSIICGRIHRDELKHTQIISFDKKPIYKRVLSTFLYKIGAVMVNSTDNILISILVSTAAVGLYSNYYTIIIAVQGFIAIISTSLVSGIGNLSATGDKKRQYDIFNMMLLFYHFIGALGLIGFSLLLNNVVTIWLGEQYLFDTRTAMIVAFNFYLSNAISPVWMYREANGLFDRVKFLMLIRAAINIVLSIVLGMFWGVSGILLATAISLIVTNLWYEPKVLFGNAFGLSQIKYWKKQIKYGVLTIVSFALSYIAIYLFGDTIAQVVIKIIVIVAITSLLFGLTNMKSQEIKTLKSLLKRKQGISAV